MQALTIQIRTKAQTEWSGDCGGDRSGDPMSNLGLTGTLTFDGWDCQISAH